MKLTPKQERFIAELMQDPGSNATHAAIRAGCKKRSAHVTAARWLKNAKVASALAARQAARAARAEIQAAAVLREIDNLATSDIGEILDFTGEEPRLRPLNHIHPDARRCISSIKVRREKTGKDDDPVEIIEFKLWDKVAALRLALQQRGLLVERHKHEGLPEHHQHLTVVFDADFYQNADRYRDAARAANQATGSPAPPTAAAAVAGPDEGRGLRPALGQDDGGDHRGAVGPRA